MQEKRTMLRGGHVVTMDDALGDLEPGDVLIEGARIAAVGPSLDLEADETIDATGMLVLPGLIDSHIHLWQSPLRGLADECWAGEYFPAVHPRAGRYRPQDMHAATYASAVDLLSHGVTTCFDFCHAVNSPEHADASVAALRDAGIRAIFGFSFRDRPEFEQRAYAGLDARIADARRLRAELPGGPDELVQLGIALNNIEQVDAETNAREIACARELGVPITVHSNVAWQVALLHERGLLGPDIQWVHGCHISAEELTMLADRGGSIAATPEIELGMGGLYPMTGRALARGVPATLGIDIPAGVSNDLLFAMRMTFQVERLREGQASWLEGRDPVRRADTPSLSARDVLRLVTVDAAEAIGLGSVTGTLTPGKAADVLLLATGPFGVGYGDPAAHVVVRASAADVDTVFVAGEPRKRAGHLVGVDEAGMRRALDEASVQAVGHAPRRLATPA